MWPTSKTDVFNYYVQGGVAFAIALYLGFLFLRELAPILAAKEYPRRPVPRYNQLSPSENFYTHECVLCKHDPDASYCVPRPVTQTPPPDCF